MAQTDAKAIRTQIKKGSFSNFYYIFGQDVKGIEALTKDIIAKATDNNAELALTKLDGGNMKISDFRDMTEMAPMLSPYNCILVNDYNCNEKREDENKLLIEALKEIPQQTVVIFNITGFDIKDGRKTVQGKNKKLTDLAAKIGICCEMPLKTSNELAKDIMSKIAANGGSITFQAAKELAEACLSDTLMIANETDKLIAYAGGREITIDTVHELVSRQSDVTIYNLADSVAAFNKKKAFEALDELMAQRVGRGAILAGIYGSFIDMYRAACAKKKGKNVSAVMHDFEYKWEFKVKNAFRDSSKMSVKRIRACLKILRDTAVQLNSTAIDEKTVLEMTVVKMLMTRN